MANNSYATHAYGVVCADTIFSLGMLEFVFTPRTVFQYEQFPCKLYTELITGVPCRKYFRYIVAGRDVLC